MPARKLSARSADRLKDEVYRQMLRLESGRPSARLLLAAALLHAWIALDEQPPHSEPRQWLRRLSPVCLRMIEEVGPPGCTVCKHEPTDLPDPHRGKIS